ncbi:DsbA family oxidoreductase [Nocardioides mangrovicus]|uniref:DsbA family oxidoreductase n=1 Tax=Nocardioides mangrovicus TaxID=2478913 RepID=A0A3L8P8U1_9ACTN|nr:DsbA family oxidoreductase [Nocardioides mangrovicus]
MADAALVVDVWADVICPWCYLGEHRLQQAIESAGEPVEVRVHAFQLDPSSPTEVGTAVEYLGSHHGLPHEQAVAMEGQMAERAAADGLPYAADHAVANTAGMHRVVQLGQEHGVGWDYLRAIQAELFAGNLEVFRADELVRIGVGLGLAEAEIREVLDGDRYAEVIEADQRTAARLGITGVPFVVLDERLGVPGAVSVEQYAEVIRQARA